MLTLSDLYKVSACFAIVMFFSCKQEYTASPKLLPPDSLIFGEPKATGTVDPGVINEASGIAKSMANPAALWTHNDSGGDPALYLIDTTGQIIGTFHLSGVNNRDWEDIATASGPAGEQSYIYLGDIGDNAALHPTYKVYRITEPKVSPSSLALQDTLMQFETIEFIYPDGPRDAEALMVDPLTGDIYIVSKRDAHAHIYRASYPQPTDTVFTFEKTGEIPLNAVGIFDQVVGGDISPDGREILLKSYVSVYYWRRDDLSTTITETLLTPPTKLPYTVEPQGEAIGFAFDGNSYFTLSEAQGGATPYIYQYTRNTQGN